jgi:hypothetical protein
MNRFLATLLLLSAFSFSFGQCCNNPCKSSDKTKKHRKERLHLQIGGAGSYLYDSNNETGFNPVPERTNFMGEAMLGIRFDQKRNGRKANVLGAWGTAGYSSPQTVELMLREQGDARQVDLTASPGTFYEMEAGLLLKEWIRISGGVGNQQFVDLSGAEQSFDYYKVTTGISLRLSRSIKWNTNAAFIFTEGMSNYSFRPSTGLSFRFNFLKV